MLANSNVWKDTRKNKNKKNKQNKTRQDKQTNPSQPKKKKKKKNKTKQAMKINQRFLKCIRRAGKWVFKINK